MSIKIGVKPLTDKQKISFRDLELWHDCGSGVLSKNRNPITNQYTLWCACGLEILLSDVAQKKIIFMAINEEAQIIESSDVQANAPGPIALVAIRS